MMKPSSLFHTLAIYTIVVVYSCSFLLGSRNAIPTVDAAGVTPHRIVAVLVDSQLTTSLSDDLQRYTTQYIQQRYSDTQALVIPIDVKGLTAIDIHRILSNLYLEGKKDASSQLIGTILIGDIPLPVVNERNHFFPTVYPYTDFVSPRYVYDEKTQYFTLTERHDDQPEVWHSLIDYDQKQSDYAHFFDKLREYTAHPSDFTTRSMRYDDFIHLKKVFSPDVFRSYLNQRLFTEDIVYQRYTNLLVDLFNYNHTTVVGDLYGNQQQTLATLSDDPYYTDPSLDDARAAYKKGLDNFRRVMKKIKSLLGSSATTSTEDATPTTLGDLPTSKAVPTKFLQPLIDGFLKTYPALYGQNYYDTLQKNLQAGGRYDTASSGADSHITKLLTKDEYTKSFIKNINTTLEKSLDNQIEDNNYYLKMPILNVYQNPKNKDYKVKHRYENFYFGLPASAVQDASDFSLYRGTYYNIKSLYGLSKRDTTKPDLEDITSDLALKSVGGTYGIQSRETESHRGYNLTLIDTDQADFERIKEEDDAGCRKKTKNLTTFIDHYRQGYTPLNIDPNSNDLRLDMSRMDYTLLRNPSRNRSYGGSVFDIAGSKITAPQRVVGATVGIDDVEEDDASGLDDNSALPNNVTSPKSYSGYSDSYLAGSFFSSANQTKFGGNKIVKFCRPRHFRKKRITHPDPQSLGAFAVTTYKTFGSKGQDSYMQFDGPQGSSDTSSERDNDTDHQYYYTFADTRFTHKSPTPDELYGFEVFLPLTNAKIIPGYTGEVACGEDNLTKCFLTPLPDGRSCKPGFLEYKDICVESCPIETTERPSADPGSPLSLSYKCLGTSPVLSGIRYGATGAVWYGTAVIFQSQGQTTTIQSGGFTLDGSQISLFSTKLFYKNRPYSIPLITGTIDGLNLSFANVAVRDGGMNYGTQDRPIDNPRSINFQGLAGDKVTLIYPNLYMTPLFQRSGAVLSLKSISQIRQSLIEYLVAKVQKYNLDIKDQLDRSDAYYMSKTYVYKYDGGVSTTRNLFDLMSKADSHSTPKRSYPLLPENFLLNQLTVRSGSQIVISSGQMLDAIAESLYYQNIMRPSRVEGSGVLADLSSIQNMSNLTAKTAYISQNYLQSNTSGQRPTSRSAASGLLLPSYNSSGYEMAYINSDGHDVITDSTLPPVIRAIQNTAANFSATQESPQPLVSEPTCELVSPNGTVALSKYPKAFACRLQKEIRNTSIKFTFPEGTTNIIQSGPKALRRSLTGNQKTFVDSWKGLSNTSINASKIKSSPPLIASKLGQILRTLTVSFSQTDIPLSTPKTTLKFTSNSDVGAVDIILTTTGTACLTYQSTNLCTTPRKIASRLRLDAGFNSSPYLLELSTMQQGEIGLVIQVCLADTTDCVSLDRELRVIPGTLSQIKFDDLTRGLTIARGAQVPIRILGLDSYNNPIGTTLQEYFVTSRRGLLTYRNQTQTGFVISDFRDLSLIYTPLSGQIFSSDSITITAIGPMVEPNTPLVQTYTMKFDTPSITLTRGPNPASLIDYTLPSTLSELQTTDLRGITSPNPNSLLRLDLSLTAPDRTPLFGFISFKTASQLLSPGEMIPTEFVTASGSFTASTFTPRDGVMMRGSSIPVYSYPSLKAGTETLTFRLGSTTVSTVVRVLPAAPRQVIIAAPSILSLTQSGAATITITDNRSNQVNQPVDIVVGGLGSIALASQTVSVRGGNLTLPFAPVAPGGKGYVYASLTGVSTSGTLPGYAVVTVSNTLRPTDHLNMMYLNLYGKDWGNTLGYQSDIRNLSAEMFARSDKLLSVTTQMIDPKTIPLTEVVIGRGGQILPLRGQTTTLFGSGGHRWYDIATVGMIDAGSYTETALLVSGMYPSFQPKGQIITYLPMTDSLITTNTLTDNSIIVNGLPLVNLINATHQDDVTITLSSKKLGSHATRSIKRNNKHIGYLILSREDNYILTTLSGSQELGSRRKVSRSYVAGSTNTQSAYLISHRDQFLSDVWDDKTSIQSSDDDTLGIGFTARFRPMTNFANGLPVGEASRGGSSPFVVNLGDPLVVRLSDNPLIDATQYDGGVGQTIFTDTTHPIDRVISIDYDQDGKKDLLSVSPDGSVRLLKNYGGSQPWKDLGHLMTIVDGIRDIFVGDADANGYPDILIRTMKDKLRIYKNNKGIFDVDGYPVCLGVSGGPDTLSRVYDIDYRDMNGDGVLDITTHDDRGDVRLFYGGTSRLFPPYGDYYISNNTFACDAQRKSRQSSRTRLIDSFGLQINSSLQLYDGSLLAWSGLVVPGALVPVDSVVLDTATSVSDLTTALDVEPSLSLSGATEPTTSSGSKDFAKVLDVDFLINQGIQMVGRYRQMDDYFRPKRLQSGSSVYYIPNTPGILLPTDPITTSKTMNDRNGDILMDGDIVDVRVTLTSRRDLALSYIEQLNGGRDIPRESDGSLIGFDRGGLPSDAQVDFTPRGDSKTLFFIHDIVLDSGQTITFSYPIIYRATPLLRMTVGVGAGSSPDITLRATQACKKSRRSYTFVGGSYVRSYHDDFVAVQPDQQSTATASHEALADAVDDATDPKILGTLVSERWNESDTLARGLSLASAYITAPISLGKGSDIDQKITQILTDTTRNICDGFQIGKKSCSGIPLLSSMPTNMAFLSPGIQQFMGCKLFTDKGLPLLYFPATAITPTGPLPFIGVPFSVPPFGPFKGPGDDFGYFNTLPMPGGTYPSLLRVYVSPTTTAKIGLGICVGPYQAGIKLPKPFRDIVGNCLAMAIDPGLGKCTPPPPSQSDYTISPEYHQLQHTDVCGGLLGTLTQPVSALTMVIHTSGTTLVPAITGPGPRPSVITLGGNIQSLPRHTTVSLIEKEYIREGRPIALKVKGPKDDGLLSCIMKKFVGQQVNYLANNLLHFNVTIFGPDFSALAASLWSPVPMMSDPVSPPSGLLTPFGTIGNKPLSFLSKSKVTQIDDQMPNVFSQIQKFFDRIQIIRLSTRDVPINIPFIYSEDLSTYRGYLDGWITRNTKIIAGHQDAIQSLTLRCDKLTAGEQQACQKKLAYHVGLNLQVGQLQQSLRRNLQTLDAYKQFPLELYVFIHTYDRYITETMAFVESFVGQITSWIQINARRLSALVDAATSLVNIIKTRQIVIDLGVNRKNKCSKCTVDNYSYYSCSYAKFCPNIPILKIPPFKIPDLVLDFSHIDLGVNIVLPKFRFLPKKLDLIESLNIFQLPDLNLPDSRTIFDANITITLPVIPLLPPPPQLGQLPSFVPQVVMKLPLLPPAPRIPKIAPEIRGVIDVADFVGQILCIAKGNIGLVGEKGLKTKIEQITQRTRSVQPFDSLQIQLPTPPIPVFNLFKDSGNTAAGFDFKLDTYVHVKAYFDQAYVVFDGIANGINRQTQGFTDRSNRNATLLYSGINSAINTIQIETDEGSGGGFGPPKGGFDITLDPLGFQPIPTTDLATTHRKLESDLSYLITKDTKSDRIALAKSVIRTIHTPNVLTPNTQGLEDIQTTTQRFLSEKLSGNQQLQYQIKYHYDEFLDDISRAQFVSNDADMNTLTTSLYTLNPETLATLQSSPSPLLAYTQLQKTMIDGYRHALQTNTPTALQMTPDTYHSIGSYLTDLSQKANSTASLLSQNNPSLSTQDTRPSPLLAQTPPSSSSLPPPISPGSTDPTQYIQGYFVSGADGKFHSVINHQAIGQQASSRTFVMDINGDNYDDITYRDEHRIVIKYGLQKSVTQNTNRNTTYTQLPLLSSPLQIATLTRSRDGYLAPQVRGLLGWIRSSSFYKIRDYTLAPQGRHLQGQNYDNMSFGLQSTLPNQSDSLLSHRQMGYVVRFVARVDAASDRLSGRWRYVLIGPDALSGLSLTLPGVLDVGTVADYLKNGTIHSVLPLDTATTDLSVILKNLPRAWYYAQVASLSRGYRGDDALVYKSSPRSPQATAGSQIAGDTKGPSLQLSLIRSQTSTLVSSGFTHQAHTTTHYTLSGLWTDDTQVTSNSIRLANGAAITTTNGTVRSSDIFSLTATQLTYILSAQDQARNITTQTVTIDLQPPTLNLNEVSLDSLQFATAVSSLSQDVDHGTVRFQKLKNGSWSDLDPIGLTSPDYNLSPLQILVTGGKFDFSNTLSLYTTTGLILGTLSPQGQIVLSPSMTSILPLLNFDTQLPVIRLTDATTRQSFFDISLKPTGLVGSNPITVLSPDYRVVRLTSLTNASFGIFRNGYCVADMLGCQVYVSAVGDVMIPIPTNRRYQGRYRWNNGVHYVITDGLRDIVDIAVAVQSVPRR